MTWHRDHIHRNKYEYKENWIVNVMTAKEIKKKKKNSVTLKNLRKNNENNLV